MPDFRVGGTREPKVSSLTLVSRAGQGMERPWIKEAMGEAMDKGSFGSAESQSHMYHEVVSTQNCHAFESSRDLLVIHRS